MRLRIYFTLMIILSVLIIPTSKAANTCRYQGDTYTCYSLKARCQQMQPIGHLSCVGTVSANLLMSDYPYTNNKHPVYSAMCSDLKHSCNNFNQIIAVHGIVTGLANCKDDGLRYNAYNAGMTLITCD